MSQVKLFIDLTRLKKPIGYMLLFWPCAWGLTLAYDFSQNLINYFFYLILFFLGAVLMRSAGCIVNDILDKEFDSKVYRTKDRPIASGKVSIKLAIFYSMTLCLLALLVLLNFNSLTIIMALGSMPLAFTYPLMKRFTYWPQLFLGITFNYGLILGWTSITGKIDLVPILFYLGAIFWTLGYDTIYGYQDIKDDEIIGCKNGTLIWEQISSSRMINQDKIWSDYKTTAKVHLILSRPGYEVIKERGTAINHGVNASVKGERISAGIGTQLISLSLDKKVICESWKFGKQTSGFFSSY